jgi:uncharacterized protein
MRNFLFVSLLLISNVLLAQQSNFIKDRPFASHVVEDYGSFLSSGDETALEKELISFRERKGYSIVIITLSSLTDNTGYTWPVEEAALQYFNKWGIGNKRRNDGVLIMLSKEPRRVRIATGTGVEAKLTDEDCQRIIDKTIVPKFKMGSYYTGLKKGVEDIESELTSWTRSSKPHNANHAQSGTADNWSSVDEPAQPQPQALVQTQTQQPQPEARPGSFAERVWKDMTIGQIIAGWLVLGLTTWLRVKWVNAKRRQSHAASPEGENVTRSIGDIVLDYVKAFVWVLFWVLVSCFGIFALLFGYNVWKGKSFSWGSSYRSGKSSGGGARASYNGGKSDGGGATGSW